MKRILILFLLVIRIVNTGIAQQLLSVEQCRAMALENSKQIDMATKQLQRQQLNVKAMRANFLPKVSASGLYMYNQKSLDYTLTGGKLPIFSITDNGVVPFPGFTGMPDIDFNIDLKGVYHIGVNVEQPIYMGGRVRTGLQMAKIGKKLATSAVSKQKDEIILEVEKAYWQLVQVRQKLILAARYEETVNQVLQTVQSAESVGMSIENNVLRVQVKCNEASLKKEKAEHGVQLAQMNLCRLIGVPSYSEIITVDEFPQVLMPADINSYEKRPEYQLMTQQIELQNKQVALQRADNLPQLGARVGYGYGGGMEINGEELRQASLNAMATLAVPVFHWNQGRNKVKMAKLEQQIVETNREHYIELMELEIRSAFLDIQSGISQVTLAEKSLTQASENMRVSQDRYDVGKEILSDLLESQTQWQQAWSELIDAKTQLLISRAVYLKSIGELSQQ
ncbi:MAG: TolC family protein [Marinifilaceae bacterium]